MEATGRAKFILCDEENEAKCLLALESRALSNVKVLVLGHVATKGISMERLMNDNLADGEPVMITNDGLALLFIHFIGNHRMVGYTR